MSNKSLPLTTRYNKPNLLKTSETILEDKEENVSEENTLAYNRTLINARNLIILKEIFSNNNFKLELEVAEDEIIINDSEHAYQGDKELEDIYIYKITTTTGENIELKYSDNSNICIVKSDLDTETETKLTNLFKNISMNLKDLLKSISNKNELDLILSYNNLKYPKIESELAGTNVEKEYSDGSTKIVNYDEKASFGEVFIDNTTVPNSDLVITWKGFLGNYSAHEMKYNVDFFKEESLKDYPTNTIDTLDSFVKVITAVNVFEKITSSKNEGNLQDEYTYDNGSLSSLQANAIKPGSSEFKKTFKEFRKFLKEFNPSITNADLLNFSKVLIIAGDGQYHQHGLQTIIEQGISDNNIKELSIPR